MKNSNKYSRGYFLPPQLSFDFIKKEYIDSPPRWCSVDLRDGNQALITPMSLEDKIEFFKLLVKVGFKEIEIGFPAASETEYEFTRVLIEQNLIPDDVTIQVLTQAREHIILKTFEALRGAKKAIVHLYNSTSKAQRAQVFKKSKEEILNIAVQGAKLLKAQSEKTEGNFLFEYSPESFTGTEPEFALEVCNAVLDELKPTAERPVIINLPVTVQLAMPHIYAAQVEYMHKNLKYREHVVISLHAHNDRGCAVADTELGLLAGGQRVEGTLFGNGERTGNVDIINVAMNMYMHGVDPLLDFSSLTKLTEVYERITALPVSPRQPYSGTLVFTAFSGSHQDAIAKGLNYRREQSGGIWNVPYLPVDPEDIGRSYESDVIRINSQSGKGGVSYLMESRYGYTLPPVMREEFSYIIKDISDKGHRELQPSEVLKAFENTYLNICSPISFIDYKTSKKDGKFNAEITCQIDGKNIVSCGLGNGALDAVSLALQAVLSRPVSILKYAEHALEQGSTARAVAYVGASVNNGKINWAAGIDSDIISASIIALIGAVNKAIKNF